MINRQFVRFIHLSSTRIALGAHKSNLAKLRKKTGYPFGNCKKALEVNNNNLEQAEKWLEEQAKALGWSKAMKMENRSTTQGLVGLAWDKQYAAMVELNCETDFVARNEKFQKLVDLVAKTCLNQTKRENPTAKTISKVFLEGPEVGKLLATDNQSLEDHVVRSVAMVGERLVLRRAALVTAQAPIILAGLTHPTSGGPQAGKYGAVLLYTATSQSEKTNQLARQLCQHVIGMNPSTVEAPPNSDEAPSSSISKKEPVLQEGNTVSDVSKEMEDGDEGLVVERGEENETSMMRQAFLLDAERTVADVAAEAGIQVQDFVRFECGEGLAENEDVAPAKIAQVGG